MTVGCMAGIIWQLEAARDREMRMRTDQRAVEFGKVVRDLRESAGWSQRMFADKVGFSRTYLNHIEQGILGPPAREKVHAIAKQLETPSYDLLSRAGYLDQDLEEACLQAQQLYGPTFMSTGGKENRQGKSKFVLMVDLDVLSTASDNDQFSKYRRGIVTATKKQLKCQQDEVLLQLGRLLEELGRALPGDAEATNDPEGR